MGVLLIGRKYVTCALAYGDNEERRCAWCGDPLDGRRTRWCSDDCSYAYGKNHYWTDAKRAARKRDGACVRCGANGADYERMFKSAMRAQPEIKAPDWRTFLASIDPGYLNDQGRAFYPHPMGSALGKTNMLRTCVDVEHRLLASRWFDLQAAAAWWPKAVAAAIAAEVLSRSLEVNHKTPILGRHDEGGCHHHVEDLETLCHRCHLIETARQRAAGELVRPTLVDWYPLQ